MCMYYCVKGIEDAQGNMDFKVAGTSEGITSIQVTHTHHILAHTH